MNLWDHQSLAISEIDSAIAAGERNICVTSPTGGGKSRIMFHRISSASRSAALYTDRRMLLSQLSSGLDNAGIVHGLRASGHPTRLLEEIQLCMVQTEGSRCLEGDRDIHSSQDIYIDEAHKNGGATMQGLLKKHRDSKADSVLLGFTATPLNIGHLYSKLVVAGTNSQLRQCGAHVPAKHYGPDEPDKKWIKKIVIGEGECGLPTRKRKEFAQRVYGSVVEHYLDLNPEQKPTVLFAPGVPESIWFAQMLSDEGIEAAHIDGENVWLDGRLLPKTDDLVKEIKDRCERGSIKVVCNRFVLREGIDWPFLYHGILATVFGSLTSYIQAGGRLLRFHPSMDHCVIQDHGGNWWRHGSLNSDREWNLTLTDRIASSIREQRLREKQEQEPITCPKCHAIRMSGPKCHDCGFQSEKRVRPVLQKDGSLRGIEGDIFRARRKLRSDDEGSIGEWVKRVRNTATSKKPGVGDRTLAQVEVSFARDHNWTYPNPEWPCMPVNESDRFRPVKDVLHLLRN